MRSTEWLHPRMSSTLVFWGVLPFTRCFLSLVVSFVLTVCSSKSLSAVTCYDFCPCIHAWGQIFRTGTSCSPFRTVHQILHMFWVKSSKTCSRMNRDVTNALGIWGMVYLEYCGNMLAMQAKLDKNSAAACIQNKQMHHWHDVVFQEPEESLCCSARNGKLFLLLWDNGTRGYE